MEVDNVWLVSPKDDAEVSQDRVFHPLRSLQHLEGHIGESQIVPDMIRGGTGKAENTLTALFGQLHRQFTGESLLAANLVGEDPKK